mgnify:CR=1 FL=1
MKRSRSLSSFYAAFNVAVAILAPSCLWATLSAYDAVIAAEGVPGSGSGIKNEFPLITSLQFDLFVPKNLEYFKVQRLK